MIHGHLAARDAYAPLLRWSAWRDAFAWLEALPADITPGIRELRGTDMYVNVHGYATKPTADCRFETHRRYVDLQYCIRGGELIDWRRAADLEPSGPFDLERDVQHYHPAPARTVLHLVPGTFAIFFPTDAHRPQQQDGTSPEIFKLVIKIAHALVDPERTRE